MSTPTAPAPSLSREVAEWAAALAYEDLPHEVVAAARRHVLDALGIALASTAQPYGKRLRDWGGPAVTGGATALGLPGAYPAEQAAMVNGVLVHGLDFDDTYQPGIVHIGAVVIPTALAVAEQEGRSTEELVTAVAVGYELHSRLGEASPGAFHRKGWHATPICGAFAAALVGARLMGHTVEETVAALGIVGSFASGIQEFLRDGTDTKRLHPGWAAQAGVQAARLARVGFEGPAAVWEGHYGLYATHLDEGDLVPEAITDGLGSRWNILGVSVKPYPCCHLMHAHIDAARHLRADGVEAGDVESVTAHIHAAGLHLLGEPVAVKQRPTTTYGAQFSLPFAVAVGFCDAEVDVRSFSAERLADPAVLDLAGRVECVVDPESAYPTHFDGALTVRLKDGRTVAFRESVNRGSPSRPLSDAELEAKFLANAALSGIPESAALEAEATIRKGDDLLGAVGWLNELLLVPSGT